MNQHFERGATLLSHHLYAEAEKELKLSLAQDPNHATALSLLASALSCQNKTDEAIATGERAIAVAPNDPFTHYIMASSYIKKNATKRALKHIELALKLDLNDPDFWAMSALIRIDMHEYSKALSDAEQGLKIDGDHVLSINARAYSLARLSRIEEARNDLERALELEPNDSFTHTNYALLLIKQGKVDAAAENLKEALRLDPNSSMAQEALLDAIKSRNPIYHKILLFTHWLVEMGDRKRLGLLLVLFLRPGVRGLIGLLFILIWSSNHLFTFLLRLDPLGKKILTDKQKSDNNKGIIIVSLISTFILFCVAMAVIYPEVGSQLSEQKIELIEEAQEAGKNEEAKTKLQAYFARLRSYVYRKKPNYKLSAAMSKALLKSKIKLDREKHLEVLLLDLYIAKAMSHQEREKEVLAQIKDFSEQENCSPLLDKTEIKKAMQLLKVQSLTELKL